MAKQTLLENISLGVVDCSFVNKLGGVMYVCKQKINSEKHTGNIVS